MCIGQGVGWSGDSGLGWSGDEDGRKPGSDTASLGEKVMLELQLMDVVSWASVSQPRNH